MSENLPQKGQFLVYEAEDGRIKIDVRLEDETVWLTQPLMAKLFQTTQQNISQHIHNIYEEGELEPEATHKKFLSVRQEGSRQVQRKLDFYNLDMIISVGYRVKSHVATRFRIWATQRLREYIVKDFVLDDERLKNPDQPFDYFEELLRRIPMYMADWIKKLDAFLNLNDRDILTHAGKISHRMAKERAEQEYEKFHARRIAASDGALSDFDRTVQQIEAKGTARRGEKFFAPIGCRRSIRLQGYDYSQSGAYFVTICTRNRACLFGKIIDGEMELNDAGRMVEKCWYEIPAHFPHAQLDEFAVMPNHVHGIVGITNDACTNGANIGANGGMDTGMNIGANVGAKNFSPLRNAPQQRSNSTSRTIGSIVRGFKIGVTKWMRQHTTVRDVWQRNYWEHIVRNDHELNKIREYIINNPAQWAMDRENPNATTVGATGRSPLQIPDGPRRRVGARRTVPLQGDDK